MAVAEDELALCTVIGDGDVIVPVVDDVVFAGAAVVVFEGVVVDLFVAGAVEL